MSKRKRANRITISRLLKKLSRVFRVLSKKLTRKKTAKKLVRAFFILVMTVCTGSLFLAVATTKPTVDPSALPKFKTHSVTIDAKTGEMKVGGTADQVGRASWYALGLPAPDALTCASTTFPRGTYLHVTNLRTRREVTCLVNDYGPEAWTGRVIDLSRGSFTQIDSLSLGTAPVEIRVVPAPDTSFNLNFPSTFGELSGYRLCEIYFSKKYCEDNRQQATPLSSFGDKH
jgi:rare lipoprotein A (peptidoglycan hydrolase)